MARVSGLTDTMMLTDTCVLTLCVLVLCPAVCRVLAVISALVAVGSCVLNDYFDLRIDAINKPEVHPQTTPAHPRQRDFDHLHYTTTPHAPSNPPPPPLTLPISLPPQRSLVQGTVRPSVALLIGSSLLTAAFAAASPVLIASPLLRRIIRAAVLAVTLYTPVFKPVPFLKNAVVAGVTSGTQPSHMHE